ncbi:DUF1444 domain-containing protein [Camelliibacillus cellulosilyticus]|uniref:DUF1444 domain-containing protein n=1 Tax=Camelliibacillus cellulosilyticus TaxID=2174486 RepID=A0ABV9GNU2_9BACL
MDAVKMKAILQEKLSRPDRKIIYNKKEDKLRVEDVRTGKGVTLSLPGIIAQYEEKKDQAIDEVVYYIEESLKAAGRTSLIRGYEKSVLPVIRSTSFPTENQEGQRLLHREHTAETRIYYALDMDQSYKLIDQTQIESEGLTEQAIDEMARFNLRALGTNPKADVVAGNTFYFINTNDGYDASRILDPTLLDRMERKAEGVLAAAVPHQDVLIFADIRNKRGYDILGQMTMKFFTSGNIPITPLPFLVENGKLSPIFIMAKNRPTDE